MSVQDITVNLDKISAKHILLLCHHNADPDAIGAAFALSSLLQRLRPRLQIKIATAEGPSLLSRQLLKVLPIKLVNNPTIEEADAIILVDTNTVQQLSSWAERIKSSQAPIIVIDHHASHPETERTATLSISDESVSSTCEIVYRFFMEMNAKISEMEALALFLGIAFDSRHFILANSTTLKIVADLIDAGVNAKEALALLSLPMKESERIARLKASKRAKLVKIGKWIIAISNVSTYQASAARALISSGAHVAVVVGQRNNRIKVSMRATNSFYEETKMHLGRDLARPLGESLDGMGGGHAISAGVNGLGNIETCTKYSLKMLTEKLKKSVS